MSDTSAPAVDVIPATQADTDDWKEEEVRERVRQPTWLVNICGNLVLELKVIKFLKDHF